jgi:hypothetical protein
MFRAADGDRNAELSNANESFADHRVTGDPPCSGIKMFGAAEGGDRAISLTLTCDPFSRLSCCAQQHAPRSTAHAPRSTEITRRRSRVSVRGITRSLRGLVQCAGAAWSVFRAAERSDRAISLTLTCDPFRGRDRQAARTSAVYTVTGAAWSVSTTSRNGVMRDCRPSAPATRRRDRTPAKSDSRHAGTAPAWRPAHTAAFGGCICYIS